MWLTILVNPVMSKATNSQTNDILSMSITFSMHAFERAHQRLNLGLNEITDFLEKNFYVKIGEEKGTNRIHCLIYSQFDNQCFVIILDEKDKHIITILPVDYYETINWKVSEKFLNEAKKLAPKVVVPDQEPSMLKIWGTVLSITNYDTMRIISLGSWPKNDSIPRMLQDSRFLEQIKTRSSAKLKENEFLDSIVLALGRNGNATVIRWNFC